VIVGGGPTGVEVAAEMYDMMTEDMSKLYPDLMPYVKIRVIELMDYVLSAYDRKLGEYTANLFKRNGIELVRSQKLCVAALVLLYTAPSVSLSARKQFRVMVLCIMPKAGSFHVFR
jgi:Pyridine nucleotide-disulphide oxidoreductase